MNLKEVEDKLRDYVTLDRFTPIEKIVYGGISIILASVLVAIITLIIKK
jgi:hypothetical protein